MTTVEHDIDCPVCGDKEAYIIESMCGCKEIGCDKCNFHITKKCSTRDEVLAGIK